MPRLTPRQQLRLANIAFVALFLIVVGLLQWIGQRYHLRVDWTQNNSNSLSLATTAVVERLEGPIDVVAYASKNGGLRSGIENFIRRYQEHKRDIQLEFVDPDTDPDGARRANIQFDGELVLRYGGASENLAPGDLNEENFTNALTRLGRRGERWLVFLTGHGERSPDRQANFDLSAWAEQLKKRGFKTRVLNLAEAKQVPQNASALVIAGPRTKLLPGEVRAIDEYLQKGGNLLWLADPGPLYGLEPIAEQLGIELLPGTLVDPTAQALVGNPSAIVVTRYNSHPIVRDTAAITVFPEAAGMTVEPPKDWESKVLLDTSERAWSETGAMSGTIQYDKGADIGGPLILGATLTRMRDNREQRVALVGDGDFLSNRIIANGGNLDLGVSMANWISHDDTYVNIPVRVIRDNTLTLSRNNQRAIVIVFLIALPLGLIASGVALWWRRRRR